jgi:hypothetical protein
MDEPVSTFRSFFRRFYSPRPGLKSSWRYASYNGGWRMFGARRKERLRCRGLAALGMDKVYDEARTAGERAWVFFSADRSAILAE